MQNIKKIVVDAKILSNSEIATDIFDMLIECPELVKSAKAGQFIKLYPDNHKNILPRPISICRINKKNNTLRLVYQKIGSGTEYFSNMTIGENIRVLGNCGNGYDLEKANKVKNATYILVGGGIGVPPLLETAKQLKEISDLNNLNNKVIAILGFRSNSFLDKDFDKYCDSVYIATDDGSVGTKGNVLDIITQDIEVFKNLDEENICIFSCGPKPMLASLVNFAKENNKNNNISIQVSMEERMACGIGACVGCVTKVMQEDGEPIFKKVCKDGPVFDGFEVVF
ncbi:MAG: dihydroorotate dehydrogenase electron transfer subunit [bacterium]